MVIFMNENKELIDEIIESLNEFRYMKRKKENGKDDDIMHQRDFMLFFIYHKAGTTMPGEISKEMKMTTPRVTTLLTSLEKDGLIIREISSTDRRKVNVTLTPQGKIYLKDKQDKRKADIQKLVDIVGTEKAEVFVDVLKKLYEISAYDHL